MSNNRNARIVSAPQPAEKIRNAESSLPTTAGETPAVQGGNAKILSASNATQPPAARTSSSASRRLRVNRRANA